MTAQPHHPALTPSSVKRYLQQRNIAPFSDIVHRFDADPDAVQAVMAFWMARGKLRRIALDAPAASCTSGCNRCGPSDPICPTSPHDAAEMSALYEWISQDAPPVYLDALAVYQHTHGA